MVKNLIKQNQIQEAEQSNRSIEQVQKQSSGRRIKQTSQQTILYIQFISEHGQILCKTHKGEKRRIYNKMSTFIGTRQPLKCKSHHQKLIIKHKTINQIIKNLQIELENQSEESSYEEKLTLNRRITQALSFSTAGHSSQTNLSENLLNQNDQEVENSKDISQENFLFDVLSLDKKLQINLVYDEDSCFWQ